VKKIFLLLPLIIWFVYETLNPKEKPIEKRIESTPVVQTSKIPAYYSKINFSNRVMLFDELSELITKTHSKNLNYTPDTWVALQKTDEDPTHSNHILMIYGTETNAANPIHDLSREKNKNGANKGEWNREHVYPRSMGRPNLGFIGVGADIHLLRPSDVSQNTKRGNLPFENSKGLARRINKSWYPGDRWRGDVARIMMYLFLRYQSQTEPSRVAKSSYTYNKDMPDLFLQWNVDDPVDNFEKRRNQIASEIQGNRNPFIDNPYIAYLLWQGPKPANLWNIK
jgi:endonuclease I